MEAQESFKVAVYSSSPPSPVKRWRERERLKLEAAFRERLPETEHDTQSIPDMSVLGVEYELGNGVDYNDEFMLHEHSPLYSPGDYSAPETPIENTSRGMESLLNTISTQSTSETQPAGSAPNEDTTNSDFKLENPTAKPPVVVPREYLNHGEICVIGDTVCLKDIAFDNDLEALKSSNLHLHRIRKIMASLRIHYSDPVTKTQNWINPLSINFLAVTRANMNRQTDGVLRNPSLESIIEHAQESPMCKNLKALPRVQRFLHNVRDSRTTNDTAERAKKRTHGGLSLPETYLGPQFNSVEEILSADIHRRFSLQMLLESWLEEHIWLQMMLVFIVLIFLWSQLLLRNSVGYGWFHEWPDAHIPLFAMWPYNIKLSLVVLWGVCWRFKPDYDRSWSWSDYAGLGWGMFQGAPLVDEISAEQPPVLDDVFNTPESMAYGGSRTECFLGDVAPFQSLTDLELGLQQSSCVQKFDNSIVHPWCGDTLVYASSPETVIQFSSNFGDPNQMTAITQHDPNVYSPPAATGPAAHTSPVIGGEAAEQHTLPEIGNAADRQTNTLKAKLLPERVDPICKISIPNRVVKKGSRHKKHMERPTKPYSCVACTLDFGGRREQQRHLDADTHRRRVGLPAAKGFACPIPRCNKNFSRVDNLTKHIRKFHPDHSSFSSSLDGRLVDNEPNSRAVTDLPTINSFPTTLGLHRCPIAASGANCDSLSTPQGSQQSSSSSDTLSAFFGFLRTKHHGNDLLQEILKDIHDKLKREGYDFVLLKDMGKDSWDRLKLPDVALASIRAGLDKFIP